MFDMYIASCCEDGGIYRYAVEDAQVTPMEALPLDRPMYMAFGGERMYVVLQRAYADGASGLTSFAVRPDGQLGAQGETCSTRGLVGCHVHVAGEDVYVANYTSGDVFCTPDKLVCFGGSSVHPTRQRGPHTHGVFPDVTGEYLYVADLGTDAIVVCDRALHEVARAHTPAGAGPRHLVLSEDGTRLYCACELDSTLCTFAVQGTQLTLLDQISTLPPVTAGANAPAAIRRRGDIVYVSNRGHDSIAVFRLTDGLPQFVRAVPTGGGFPRDFDLCGDFMACTNETGNSVTFFRAVGDDLLPLPGSLSVKSPLCVAFRRRE